MGREWRHLPRIPPYPISLIETPSNPKAAVQNNQPIEPQDDNNNNNHWGKKKDDQ